MSPVLVCSRPAVSAMRTFADRAVAACRASKTTAAESAPGCWAMTGTPFRSPQTWIWSIAAARKVSPAASITEYPSSPNRCASLPMVVVLPTPFTPTTSTTKGRSSAAGGGISQRRATGSSACTMCSRSAPSTADPSASRRRLSRSWRSATMMSVRSTPTSAPRRMSSTSSMRAASIFRPREKRSARPLARFSRVRLRAVRRRPKIPERGGVSGRSEVSEAGGMFAVGRGPGQDGREV